MTVYVDRLMPCIPNRRWRCDRACHLFADSTEELHAFAGRLGLKRGWFQGQSRLDHYDLTPGKRRQAIALGAVAADPQTVVHHMRPRKGAKAQTRAEG